MNERKIQSIASETTIQHNPPFDVWQGRPERHFDIPDRAIALLQGLSDLSSRGIVEISQPEEFPDNVLYQVHTREYVEFLKECSKFVSIQPDMWIPMITNEDTGEVRSFKHSAWIVPCDVPRGVEPNAQSLIARAGQHAFDLSTPIMGNTFDVAKHSAEIALTAAKRIVNGETLAYALCRPSGHHAEQSRSGGYCYLNNTALAAKFIQSETGKHVGILDIDAHHGNGTESIFYSTKEVSYASIHINTSVHAPYYTGQASCNGEGEGLGYNHNFPLEIKASNDIYLNALNKGLLRLYEHSPSFLVVSLGFDGYVNDPLGLFNLTKEFYAVAAQSISQLKIPILTIQEGGYNIGELPELLSVYLENLKVGAYSKP
jgi:acetoin utilization deacetylase AcuC-like enzyme